MKFLPSLGLLLLANFAVAQTDPTSNTTTSSANSATAPVKKLPNLVDSVPPRTPTTSPDTHGPGWEKRALSNIEKGKAEAASINLIFDGDSITDFWQRKGLQIWTDRFTKYHPINFGISGDTVQNVLWRLGHRQAEGMHPKLIALMIGTNNMKQASTPQEIADGVKAIIAEYQKRCPDAVILLQAIFPRAMEPTDPFRLKVKATNEILAKLGDGTKVIYLDFGDKFLTPEGLLTKDIMPDALHPNEKGYQIWADAIQPTLDKYFPPK